MGTVVESWIWTFRSSTLQQKREKEERESKACKLIPYSAYISRVFNFTNFANLESFVKFIQLNLSHCAVTHMGKHKFAKNFSTNSFKAAICENLDPRNISAIRYTPLIERQLQSETKRKRKENCIR